MVIQEEFIYPREEKYQRRYKKGEKQREEENALQRTMKEWPEVVAMVRTDNAMPELQSLRQQRYGE